MPRNLKQILKVLFAGFLHRKVGLWLAICLLGSCNVVDTDLPDSVQVNVGNEQETAVPSEIEVNNMSETPELQPKNATTEESNNPELPIPTTEKPVEAIEITTDVIIPDYKPLDVPYSKWETHRSQELLTANGFGNTVDEWRKATQHSSGLIRSTAYYLLTRHPEQQDEDLFRQGLDDIDQTVQTLSSYGLYLLGDRSALPTLERIAQLDVNAHTAATQAAGILAEIGEPTAFAVIQKAMNSDLGYIRLFAMQNAMPFVPLHGQTYTVEKTIDIWDLYRQALQDENDQVKTIAKLQLQELDSPEALALLQNYSKAPR